MREDVDSDETETSIDPNSRRFGMEVDNEDMVFCRGGCVRNTPSASLRKYNDGLDEPNELQT